MKKEDISLMIDYAKCFLGKPYKWGGNGPLFDCSGLVIEIYKSIGLIKNNYDNTAQGIYNDLEFDDRFINKVDAGALAFYGYNTSKITHVSFLISKYHMIEASGSATVEGMVRIRPIRGDFVNCLCPRLKDE